MRSHNSSNIHGENLHIWAVDRKNYFSKTKVNFYKKTTPQLLEHIGLQNMKVGEKTNLGDLPLFVWCMLTLALKTEMRQIYKVRPSISPWKRNNITEIFLFSPLLPSVSDNTSVKSIHFSRSLSIHCKFPLHVSTRSVPTQLYHHFQTILIAPIVSPLSLNGRKAKFYNSRLGICQVRS